MQSKENKMGVMPVPQLLVSMSLPIMISMLVQSLYNIVDSIFVSQINEEALTAVSLAFPIQCLMIAFATGTGVGINSYLSKSLGEKKQEEADKCAVNGVFLAVCHYLLFAVIGIFLLEVYMKSQTEGLLHGSTVCEYGVDYLRVVTICSFGLFGQITFERLLQSTGKTIYTMISQVIGAVINIILDPVFIFGLLGAPKMGVTGAAVATVIGQIIAMFVAIVFNLKVNHDIHIKVKGFRPDGHTIGIIYKVGIPSIIMQAITSVLTFGLNKILVVYQSAIAVYGVYFKINSFIFMPIFGLNNGMVPIIAYNYGARHKKRIKDTIRLGIIVALSIMILGTALFQLAPGFLLKMFNASPTMLKVGIPAFRIISLSFPVAAVSIVFVSTLQAFGEGMKSLVISVARQLVVILPVTYVLSKTVGIPGLWSSFPIAEIVSLILCSTFIYHLFHVKIKDMPD